MAALVRSARQLSIAIIDRGMQSINKRMPPAQRSKLVSNLKSWASQHPYFAVSIFQPTAHPQSVETFAQLTTTTQSFILAHIACSGIPVAVFLTFSSTVLFSALATCLSMALVAALSFAAFCVGGALLLFVPTMFVTTFMATSLFFWGNVAFALLQWINKARSKAPSARDVERSFQSSIKELERDTSSLERIVSEKMNGGNGYANGVGQEKKLGYEKTPSTPALAERKSDSAAAPVKEQPSSPSSALAATQKPLVPTKPSSKVDISDPALKDKWTSYLEQAGRSAKPQSNANGTQKPATTKSDAVEPKAVKQEDGQTDALHNGQWSHGALSPSHGSSGSGYRMTMTQDNKLNMTEDLLGGDGGRASDSPLDGWLDGEQQHGGRVPTLAYTS